MYRRFGLRLHTPFQIAGRTGTMCSPRTPPKSELLHLRLFHISCDHAMYRMTLSKTAAGKAYSVLSPQL